MRKARKESVGMAISCYVPAKVEFIVLNAWVPDQRTSLCCPGRNHPEFACARPLCRYQTAYNNTIPDMRRAASTCALGCSFESILKNHAPRMVRCSRNDSSQVERNSFSRQPNGSKNAVPCSGKNCMGALPCC